jgi:tRNA threonylcarbamoyladenosine biosynthesis protein TsaB
MLIVTIRTDKPEAELGLYDDTVKVAYEAWEAHRQLAETIHVKLRDVLAVQHCQLTDLGGLVVFQGPGSFTGLRIGVSVANALAASLHIPIVASQKEDWRNTGINRLLSGRSDTLVVPEYGAPVHITRQKK